MLQNNDFTKAWIDEKYLPDHQRHSLAFRLTRLAIYICLMFTVAGQVATANFEHYELAYQQRRACMLECEDIHFPRLACAKTTVHEIVLHNTRYSDLFYYLQQRQRVSPVMQDVIRTKVLGWVPPDADADARARVEAQLTRAFAVGRVPGPERIALAEVGKLANFANFNILQIFGGLVLGCIKTKFCNKICVRQHFSRSTRFAYFCTAAI